MTAVESSEAFLCFDGCAHPFALRAIAVSLGAPAFASAHRRAMEFSSRSPDHLN
jgi:hypothetical protein